MSSPHYRHLYIYGWIGLFISVVFSNKLHTFALSLMPNGAYFLQLAIVLPIMFAARSIVYVLQQRALHREIYDVTTGVKKRNSFGLNSPDGELPKLFAAKNAAGKPLTFIYFDANRFKEVNDTYGHLIGDEVLRELAKTAIENIRPGDEIGRWGGDEFLAIIHGDVETGSAQLPKISGARWNRKCSTLKVRNLSRSASSFGVAAASPKWTNERAPLVKRVIAAIKAADAAMYAAKKTGRNKVVVNDLAAPLMMLQEPEVDFAGPLLADPADKILYDKTQRETFLELYANYFAQPGEFTAVYLAVDHLGKFNDRAGHLEGNKALRARSSKGILRHLPEGHRIDRVDGNSFGFVLEGSAEQAAHVAETIRQAIERAALGVTARFVVVEKTIIDSVGRSSLKGAFSWIETIGHALYDARVNGRNRVTVVSRERFLEMAG